MNKYTNYTFEDFILDESFNNYALKVIDEDTLYWENWFNKNHINIKIAIDACKCIQSVKFKKNKLPEQFKNNEWALLSQKLQFGKKTKIKRNKIVLMRKYVAAFVLLIGLFNVIYFSSDLFNISEEITYTKIYTPKGKIRTILLPDSTLVYLNSDTKLKYGSDFGKNNREVYLEGEAYFDVIHNPNKTFIVHTSEYDIKVLGTAFNVSAYLYDNIYQTSLERGKISIIDKKGKKSTLNPDEIHLLIRNKKQSKIYRIENINKYSSWRKGEIFFCNQSFKNIARELERTYNIHFYINKKEIENLKYTGKFDRNDSITKILKILKLTTEFNYTLKNDTVEIN